MVGRSSAGPVTASRKASESRAVLSNSAATMFGTVGVRKCLELAMPLRAPAPGAPTSTCRDLGTVSRDPKRAQGHVRPISDWGRVLVPEANCCLRGGHGVGPDRDRA